MIHAAIMAGGKGTRFWPLSRSKKPKQFLSILNNTPLLELTIQRLEGLVDRRNIWIIGSTLHHAELAYYKTLIPEEQILFEPVGKNTAPCIGWAAVEVLKKDPEATLIVLPADAYVPNPDQFRADLAVACETVAQTGNILTIGIQPTSPHTGYGYIEARDVHARVTPINAFREKPDLSTAERFLQQGNFYWNAGIFAARAKTFLTQIHQHLPETGKILDQIALLDKTATDHAEALSQLFHTFESISIDYGVMEKCTAIIQVVKAGFAWSDIGSWAALEPFWAQNHAANAADAQLLEIESSGNVVYSKKALVAMVDIHDLIIVDSDDALLILPKAQDQRIKEIVDRLPDALK